MRATMTTARPADADREAARLAARFAVRWLGLVALALAAAVIVLGS